MSVVGVGEIVGGLGREGDVSGRERERVSYGVGEKRNGWVLWVVGVGERQRE